MYYSIHACRAAAAMLVVLFHLGGTFAQDKYFGAKALDGPFSWGDAGVDFFFVLSGFIITVTHRRDWGHPERIGNYLVKRFTRIYPAYWIVFAALCAAAVFVPSFRQSMPGDATVYLKSLALVPQNPDVVGGTGAPVLFVAWSLQYELVFYLVFAVFILNRWAGLLLTGLMLANFAACVPAASCGFPRSFLATNFLVLFALGVGVALLQRSAFRWRRARLVATLGVLGFVAVGMFEWALRPAGLPIDRRLVYGVSSAVVIAALAQAENEGSIAVESRAVRLLGDSSYALYLIHIPVISLLSKLLLALKLHGSVAVTASFVAVFAACVGAAALFHLGVERPAIRLLRGRRIGLPAVAASVASPAMSDRRPG